MPASPPPPGARRAPSARRRRGLELDAAAELRGALAHRAQPDARPSRPATAPARRRRSRAPPRRRPPAARRGSAARRRGGPRWSAPRSRSGRARARRRPGAGPSGTHDLYLERRQAVGVRAQRGGEPEVLEHRRRSPRTIRRTSATAASVCSRAPATSGSLCGSPAFWAACSVSAMPASAEPETVVQLAPQAPPLLLAGGHDRLARVLDLGGHPQRVEDEGELADQHLGERDVGGAVELAGRPRADDQPPEQQPALADRALDPRLVQLRPDLCTAAARAPARARSARPTPRASRAARRRRRAARRRARRRARAARRAAGRRSTGRGARRARGRRRRARGSAAGPPAAPRRARRASALSDEPASVVASAKMARKASRLPTDTPATMNARRSSTSTSTARSRRIVTGGGGGEGADRGGERRGVDRAVGERRSAG